MNGASLEVLALAPYPEPAPSTRYRLVQFQPALRALGVELTVHPFFSPSAYRWVRRGGPLGVMSATLEALRSFRSLVAGVGRYDALLIQRGIGFLFDRSLLATLLRHGVPLVYDFDDAVFLPQEHGRRWMETLRGPRPTAEAFCRGADRVLAGNTFLADFARSAVGPPGEGRVRVLPSVVDTDRFAPALPRSSALPTLGWVGSDSTVPYLEALAPALRALAEEVPHRLRVVAGERRPKLPGVDYEFVSWAPDEEASHFQALDVGLYPLPDTPWSRGKCGFKALQYLACGVPCVASPVGVLRDIVRPGETGLHASGDAAWVEACRTLLTDAELRARMGARGRALVESEYSVAHGAPVLAATLREAAESRGGDR